MASDYYILDGKVPFKGGTESIDLSEYTFKDYIEGGSYDEEKLILVDTVDNGQYRVINPTRPFVASTLALDKSNNHIVQIGGGGGDNGFSTDLDDSTTTVTPSLSDLSGFTVAQLEAYNGGIGGFLLDWIIPTILASVDTGKSVVLSGVTAQTVEVGTSFSPTLTATFSQGQIRNGNGTLAGVLVGAPTSYEFRDPSAVVIPHTPDAPLDNSQQATAPAYVCATKGTFSWSVNVGHGAGATLYYDNKDTTNPDSNLSVSTGAGTISGNSSIVTTRYKVWWTWGNQSSSPTNSAGVRALLNNQYLDANDAAVIEETVPAGSEEFSYYRVAGKTDQVIDRSNLNLPLAFTVTALNVDDADSTAVSYEKVTVFFGLGGRAGDTDLTITIN